VMQGKPSKVTWVGATHYRPVVSCCSRSMPLGESKGSPAWLEC
jgi:hypothetical protein